MIIEELKCPICGANSGFSATNGWLRCQHCNSEFYIASDSIMSRLTMAESYMRGYQFDYADREYATLSDDAYRIGDIDTYVTATWGRLLASLGVIYIHSFEGDTYVPTFSRFPRNLRSIKESEYYLEIMDSTATTETKTRYEAMADRLDVVYRDIVTNINATPIYDVFICAKVSTKTERDSGAVGYTRDSMIARDMYARLEGIGLKVFFSEINARGIEYDAMIFSALLRSKVMLVISTDKDYLESQWVESEWMRWLGFVRWHLKDKESLILYLPDYAAKPFVLPAMLEKNRVQYYTSDRLFDLPDIICDAVNRCGGGDVVEDIESETLLSAEEIDALIKKGDSYYIGSGTEQNYAKAVEYYREAMRAGSVDAMKRLAICYRNGEGVTRDYSAMLTLYENALRLGDGESAFVLGDIYSAGAILERDSERAFGYYKRATNLGYTRAFPQLADAYYYGNGTAQSYSDAVNWYAKSQSDGYSLFMLAECYDRGYGVAKNTARAVELYRLSAEAGYPAGIERVYGSQGVRYSILAEYDKTCYVSGYAGTSADVTIAPYSNGYKVVGIARDAFKANTTIQSVRLPSTIVKIGDDAFSHCYNLERVNIPSSVETIGKGVFAYAKSLRYVDISEGVREIGEEAFAHCTALESIVLPSSLVVISASMFSHCLALRSVTIGYGTQVIGTKAFFQCRSIERLDIPSSVEEIYPYILTLKGAHREAELVLHNRLGLDRDTHRNWDVAREGLLPTRHKVTIIDD